jgi:hypothetical protein
MKTKGVSPKRTLSKINSINAGPVWTVIEIRIATKDLNAQTKNARTAKRRRVKAQH